MDSFDTWGLDGAYYDPSSGSFSFDSNTGYDPSIDFNSFNYDLIDPNIDYSFNPSPASAYDFGGSIFGDQPLTADYSMQNSPSPLNMMATNDIPINMGYEEPNNFLTDSLDAVSTGFGKIGDFLGSKNNMSTLLTLATLASMGKKPKNVDQTGPKPGSVLASEKYAQFTPTQQAYMNALATRKNLMPLAQTFDPRTYGYGPERQFFTRES